MAPVEPWERIWIDADLFAEDTHAEINCTDCHGGQSVDDMADAHTGLVSEAASSPETCTRCHDDDGLTDFNNSLHNTLRGYDTALYARSAPEHHATLEAMEANHCNSCHATCGDCHVSQPSAVGGGLLEGHVFVETPSMSRNCTACHGSRVKNEYYGTHEDVPSDVHFRARMSCTECHDADEMHGMGLEKIADRYDGTQQPTCESCHEDVIGENATVFEHKKHDTDLVSCQVCHSTSYTNCTNCHVEQNEDGVPFFTVEDHSLGFYIGLNPEPTDERPYKYVPVRHVPVDPDSFSFYGEDLLPNFDSQPTWVYATPHNIQRIAPQAERCRSCHENDDVFLTADKVDPDEQIANQAVMVEAAPER